MYQRRLCLGLLSAALCLVALDHQGLAQSAPQPRTTTFRSTVDLLTIDTSVRDKAGVPVTDLQAADFTVTVDGRPRKVVSAVFFKADTSGGARLSGGAQLTPRHVSNDATVPGKVIVFVLDAQSIRRGQEKVLFETAYRMLEGLSPSDAVGVNELPGSFIPVSRDHARVAEALRRFSGRARTEAEVFAEGKNIEQTDRAHTRDVLLDLAKLLRQMGAVRAPRSVILISGGIVLHPELLAEYSEVQRAAAESRVGLYTVLLEQVGYDMERGEKRADVEVNPALSDGLATLASRTGGMFFTGIGRAVGVFDRLASELSSFYQLGLESSPADADGKQHDVKVRVSRPGLDVRTPSHIAVTRPSKAAPRDPLQLALVQPTDVPDVPLAMTTYSTRPGGGSVQLLISAEIGASNGAAPAEWGVAIDQHGKNVVTRRGRIPAGAPRPWVLSTTFEVPPGEYRLRVAAADVEDRIGVLESRVTAGYEKTDATVAGDLIVGVALGGQLEPRRRIAQSEAITAMLEVAAASGASLGGTLQLIPGGSARSVLSTPLTVRPAASPGAPATLEASGKLAAVPPGRYTVSAAVTLDGQPVTRISRVIEITAAVEPVTRQPDVVVPVADAPVAAPVDSSVAPSVASPVTVTAGSPDEIMRRVGAYVEQYGGQASLLVGIEHYSQSVTHTPVLTPGSRNGMRGMAGNAPVDRIDGVPTATSQRRRLVSEFALVASTSTSGGWLGYRDVIEMNGKPVADGRDRLQALFRSDIPDLQEARRIADESARHNIGPVSRNFNVPTTTLFFFHSANLSRFSFRRKGRERIDNIDTIEIDFREERLPTLIMNSAGKDVPASGTLWVNPLDGAIVRTRLELAAFDDVGSKAVVEVQYQKDKALAMWLPSRMTEHYAGVSLSGFTQDTAKTEATYRDFKRFQTSGRIK